MRGDLHPVPSWIEASRHGAGAAPLSDFHYTQAAGSVRYEPLVVAEGRNADARFLSGSRMEAPRSTETSTPSMVRVTIETYSPDRCMLAEVRRS